MTVLAAAIAVDGVPALAGEGAEDQRSEAGEGHHCAHRPLTRLRCARHPLPQAEEGARRGAGSPHFISQSLAYASVKFVNTFDTISVANLPSARLTALTT